MNQLPLIEQSAIQSVPPFIVSSGDAYELFRRIAWTYAHQRLQRTADGLLAEGAIVWTRTHTGDAYQATDFGLQKYRRSA
tara:strand:- start:8342 stop:8581 length:240 start_codon:yes stop_codon:yes gene_type:complete